MPLTYEQAVAVISKMHQHVTNMWTIVYYEACPRDMMPQNLEVMDENLRLFIEEIERYAELRRFVPSVLNAQYALQETVGQISLARSTFAWHSFLERRKGFYEAYRGIFKGLEHTRSQLSASGVASQPSGLAPLVYGMRAKESSSRFADRITEVRRIFLYRQSPLEITQANLLHFEKDFRSILACLVTSPDLKKCLRFADKAQEQLRETILRINFAADVLDLPSLEEQSRQFLKIHKKVLENLTQLEEGFQLRK
jgi:hypothetical protein